LPDWNRKQGNHKAVVLAGRARYRGYDSAGGRFEDQL
jgi:hypothetical protein